MLELCKEILIKVSFDKYLFQKELNKSLKWVNNSEDREQFGKIYPEVVRLAFAKKTVSQ